MKSLKLETRGEEVVECGGSGVAPDADRDLDECHG